MLVKNLFLISISNTLLFKYSPLPLPLPLLLPLLAKIIVLFRFFFF